MTTNWEPRVYRSSDSGAPSLSGTTGSLLGVLAALTDGYGSVTVNSLVVASNVATATVSAGHQFTMLGDVGPIVRIAGASPSGLNIDVRITVTDTTHFTFPTTGITDQTATGTITAKRAPAGFSALYTGTNKLVLKRDAAEATAMVLRIDDSPAQYPTVIMYESMTDIDTGTGPAPTSSSLWIAKSTVASSLARDWVMVADPLAFYLFIKNDGNNWYGNNAFGDLIPALSTDHYHCVLVANTSATYSANNFYSLNNSNGTFLAREQTQSGSAIAANRKSHVVSPSTLGASGATYTAGSTPFFCAEVDCWNSANTIRRGLMPGLYMPLHPGSSFSQGEIKTNVPGVGTLMVQLLNTAAYAVCIEIKNPWRSF